MAISQFQLGGKESNVRILKYDRGYSRRHFMKQVASGMGAAGVLAPMWDTLAATGDLTKAYPEELLSLEVYTKGKIKNGDVIDASNVDLVKDILEPIKYEEISKLGRKITVAPTNNNIMELSPWEYMEATFKNRGQATFDARGNVVTRDGKPWIGGNPFPDGKTAQEMFSGLTLSWGRHDGSFYAVKEYDLTPDGNVTFRYDIGWAELSAVARVSMDPKPYWPGHEDKLRFQSVFFTSPDNVKGTSFLNIWAYDQHTFPDLYGYLPQFKRIRQFPTDQRFEPLIPGSSLYLSDAWTAGDPMYTWGNYRIVGRGPLLAGSSDGWNPDHPNWEHTTHGGPKGKTFWDSKAELLPECIIIDAEPVMYPRAPISKKRVWIDARTMLPVAMVSYDRRGQAYRSFDGAYALYKKNGKVVMDGKHPYWSWAFVHCHDIQTGNLTRLEQVKQVGGYESRPNQNDMYDRYLTTAALQRLGSA